jgi:hypothetical protein
MGSPRDFVPRDDNFYKNYFHTLTGLSLKSIIEQENTIFKEEA